MPLHIAALSKHQCCSCVQEVALGLAELSLVLTPDCDSSDLLDTYIKLCSDRVWAVRKACADVLPDLSKAASMQMRIDKLVPVFDQFCEDVSHWVQLAALRQLGPFIATLEANYVPESEWLAHMLLFKSATGIHYVLTEYTLLGSMYYIYCVLK